MCKSNPTIMSEFHDYEARASLCDLLDDDSRSVPRNSSTSPRPHSNVVMEKIRGAHLSGFTSSLISNQSRSLWSLK